MVGGLLENGRKLQLADINLAVTYDCHAFSGSLRYIGGFNIGGVTRNPPICQIIPRQYFWPYSSSKFKATLLILYYTVEVWSKH